MDEAQRDRGRALHTRAVDGEALSAEEQAELEEYYAWVDSLVVLNDEARLHQMEARNQSLATLTARSEAFVEYLRAVLTAADAERLALEREFQRLAA